MPAMRARWVTRRQRTGQETYRQTREMVAQDGAQGDRRGDVNLSELGRRHLSLSALAEVDSTQRDGQSPQAAALRQLPCGRLKKFFQSSPGRFRVGVFHRPVSCS